MIFFRAGKMWINTIDKVTFTVKNDDIVINVVSVISNQCKIDCEIKKRVLEFAVTYMQCHKYIQTFLLFCVSKPAAGELL